MASLSEHPADMSQGEDTEESLQFLPNLDADRTVGNCSRQRRVYFALLAAASVLSVTIGLSWTRPGGLVIDSMHFNRLWYNPAAGHRDQWGNFVANTWDHFVWPQCDSGFTVDEAGNHVQTPQQAQCSRDVQSAAQYHTQLVNKHWGFVSYKKQLTELRKWQGTHVCTAQEVDADYGAMASWKDWKGGASGAHCQRACTWNQACDGFSWVPGNCFLKKLNHTNASDVLARVDKKGVVSGLPCSREEREFPWLDTELDKHALPEPKEPREAPPGSMLCIELVLPYSYEIGLVSLQYDQKWSIFQCEKYAVYSSELLTLPNGLTTRLVNTSQAAEMAGQWGTALNTDVFMAVWRAVILDGDYLTVSWVIKVDPDTVWFPDRLRPLLLEQEAKNNTEGQGVYLNNCQQGMHGPLEAFSQNAIRTLAQRSKQCFWDENAWGNWQWGEDMWVDQCFMKTVHERRVFIPTLLVEAHCIHWWGWESCQAVDRVAFHPFKELWRYKNCVGNALRVSATTTTTTHTLHTPTSVDV